MAIVLDIPPYGSLENLEPNKIYSRYSGYSDSNFKLKTKQDITDKVDELVEFTNKLKPILGKRLYFWSKTKQEVQETQRILHRLIQFVSQYHEHSTHLFDNIAYAEKSLTEAERVLSASEKVTKYNL